MSFHINGGPVSIDDKYFKIISKDTDIFMQVCTAGNLRTAIICANEAYQNNVFDRFLIATDTPMVTRMLTRSPTACPRARAGQG